MGYSAVAIGNRVGHESSDITFRYAHLMPSIQDEIAIMIELCVWINATLPWLEKKFPNKPNIKIIE